MFQFLREVRTRLPRLRFWWIVVLALLTGGVVVAPTLYLISHDQTGTAGFLSDCLRQLFASALALTVSLSVLHDARKDRPFYGLGRRIKQLLGALLFLLLALFGFFIFVDNVKFHFQTRHLAAAQSVRVGCKEISEPKDVERVAAAVRSARWFAPASHGWSHDIPFTFKLRSGRELHYFLSRSLSKQSAVVVSPAQNPGRAVSAELAAILTELGAWQATPKWSDYRHSYYSEMAATEACPPAPPR